MKAAITAASAAALLVCLAIPALAEQAQPKDRAGQPQAGSPAPAAPASQPRAERSAQPQAEQPQAAQTPPAGCRLIWHKSNPSAGGNMSGINVTANAGGEPIPLEAVGCQSTGVSIEVK